MIERSIAKHIVICLLLLISVAGHCKNVKFITSDNQPIADVRCIGYSAANDSIGCWTSDKNGTIDIKKDGINYIVTSHSGYSEKVLFMDKLNAGENRVVLTPGVDLKEVVVTPKDMEEFDTHISYRLSQKDMSRYPTVLQSLNEIPNLTVLTDGSVFFEGSSDIKILIDGVDASPRELQTLSKEDVAKVDVYPNPPARFLVQGITGVIDVRLKSDIHGGNVGLDISQAFQSLVGDNSAALYYNYKRSRFTLRYTNENKHYRKYRQSETLDYDFDGVHYEKKKEGLDSKEHLDDNAVNLSYQINKPQSYLYNVKAAVAFNRDGKNALQNVTTRDVSFLATNKLQTNYTRYLVGNYYEKDFGDKNGKFLGNVNFQHFANSYNSIYNEDYDGPGSVNDSRSEYHTASDALFSELQYQLRLPKLGMLWATVQGTYKHSRHVDTSTPFSQTTADLGGTLQWSAAKGRFFWYISLGAKWLHSSRSSSKAYDLCVPQSYVGLNWRPAKNIRLNLDYSYSGTTPTISQLSETEQWLDTRLVYHGNAGLRPYRMHEAELRFIWFSKYHSVSWSNDFKSAPGMICDMYTLTDRYMLQTLVNLSRYRQWSTMLDLAIKPLGNNKLVFWNRVILADINGKNNEYSWHGYRYQWMSNLVLNLEHWTAALYYQYPGKASVGQLVRPRAQCWSATVLYRPMTNLSVGVDVFMPFGKGFTDSERTVKEAPVHYDTHYTIMDMNNLVSLKLSYNFSFGRNRNSAAPEFDKYDDDSGILKK